MISWRCAKVRRWGLLSSSTEMEIRPITPGRRHCECSTACVLIFLAIDKNVAEGQGSQATLSWILVHHANSTLWFWPSTPLWPPSGQICTHTTTWRTSLRWTRKKQPPLVTWPLWQWKALPSLSYQSSHFFRRHHTKACSISTMLWGWW